jgi:diaminopropionate ammonia-lyase
MTLGVKEIMGAIKWKSIRKIDMPGSLNSSLSLFTHEAIYTSYQFHRSMADYQPTPLRSLPNLANHWGVGGVYIKDESYRFGLNSFKGLGGSYAVARYLSRLTMKGEGVLSFHELCSEKVKSAIGMITFTTATDGNHGRGVAWAAKQLGHHAVIYMPKGSSPARLQHITDTGAEGFITDMNYDDTVRFAAEQAERKGWVIVQDTAWEGYHEIPAWIMQGYATLAAESQEQLKEHGIEHPTHLFLQAGVGSFAAAVAGYFISTMPDGGVKPITVIVEPDQADCYYRSAMADDGAPRVVDGEMETIMAGLACGVPNPVAWTILRDNTDLFISCPDYTAAKGMRMLGNPLAGDPPVTSGESGAVTTGIVEAIMKDNDLKEVRELLQLDERARVLLISTEGDTDPQQYRSIVWDGSYSI